MVSDRMGGRKLKVKLKLKLMNFDFSVTIPFHITTPILQVIKNIKTTVVTLAILVIIPLGNGTKTIIDGLAITFRIVRRTCFVLFFVINVPHNC